MKQSILRDYMARIRKLGTTCYGVVVLLLLFLGAHYWLSWPRVFSSQGSTQLAAPAFLVSTLLSEGIPKPAPGEPVDVRVSLLLEQLAARPIVLGRTNRGLDPRGSGTCAHRLEHAAYPWPVHNASPAFRTVADAYEKFHARCTAAGNVSELLLKGRTPPCRYIIYTAAGAGGGLGNQLLGLVSTLLYAMLTSRVLLLDQTEWTLPAPLLCEPFEGSSWLLPKGIPLQSSEFPCGTGPEGQAPSAGTYNATLGLSPVMCLDAKHCSNGRFILFCEADSKALEASHWLAIHSNQYFLPSFYYQGRFLPVLRALFPDNRVSTALMRRFVHPTDAVWAQIKKAYASDMADRGYRIGGSMSSNTIQI